MRIVLQRVSSAKVEINQRISGQINQGFLVLLGVEDKDTLEDIQWLCQKIVKLRIFGDSEGKMNLDISAVGGNILVVSQFTLHAKTKKGNRPSYIKAGEPKFAEKMYHTFIEELNKLIEFDIQSGEFGANMQVSLVNDGPVTLFMDTKNKE